MPCAQTGEVMLVKNDHAHLDHRIAVTDGDIVRLATLRDSPSTLSHTLDAHAGVRGAAQRTHACSAHKIASLPRL
jgi:hypothetical protein